jgi:hypothetical protein
MNMFLVVFLATLLLIPATSFAASKSKGSGGHSKGSSGHKNKSGTSHKKS